MVDYRTGRFATVLLRDIFEYGGRNGLLAPFARELEASINQL